MLINILIIIGQLIILYFLSRWISLDISKIVYWITRSRTISISFLSLIFFPGTVIHELSHLFTASILGVRTGRISFEPIIPKNIEKNHNIENITTGHVMIAETDPFRRYLIGTAPLSAGLLILAALSYFLPDLWQKVSTTELSLVFKIPEFYLLLLLLYLLFSVSNTMFSSPSDLKGIWGILIVISIVVISLLAIGFRITIPELFFNMINKALASLIANLVLVISIDLISATIVRLLIKMIIRPILK